MLSYTQYHGHSNLLGISNFLSAVMYSLRYSTDWHGLISFNELWLFNHMTGFNLSLPVNLTHFSKFTLDNHTRLANIRKKNTGPYRNTSSCSMQNSKSIYWIQIPPFGIAKNKSCYICTSVLLYHRVAISRLADDITSYMWEKKTLRWNPAWVSPVTLLIMFPS